MRPLLVIIALFLAVAPAFADLYQWTDQQGVVHITDSLEKVPQAYRGKVRVIKEGVKEPGPSLETTTPPALSTEPEAQLYGDQTLEWWRQSFNRKKSDIDQLQTSINTKTDFMSLFESGRRVGQIYTPDQVARYNLYRSEMPEDLRRLSELREEYEELQRKATIAGVPKEIREQ
ncbi:MAG TPA: DUF4124 domain-containing protein [Thermodesulfobacteriota bacterium]